MTRNAQTDSTEELRLVSKLFPACTKKKLTVGFLKALRSPLGSIRCLTWKLFICRLPSMTTTDESRSNTRDIVLRLKRIATYTNKLLRTQSPWQFKKRRAGFIRLTLPASRMRDTCRNLLACGAWDSSLFMCLKLSLSIKPAKKRLRMGSGTFKPMKRLPMFILSWLDPVLIKRKGLLLLLLFLFTAKSVLPVWNSVTRL